MSESSCRFQVLLIEDDHVDQEYFDRIIRGSGQADVACCGCLHDGIRLLREGAFDVAVFDLGLPDSYGIDTIKRMTEEFTTLPLIVITDSVDQQTAERAFEYGIAAYLVKGDVESERVLETVLNAADAQRRLLSGDAVLE